MINEVLVIIITFNGQKWINNCLNSILSKDNVDILCIDNNSTDQTIEIIETEYPKVILLKNITNLGFGQANNIGFDYAIKNGYQYVFLLNQDTWIELGSINRLKNTFKKYKLNGILSPLHLDPNSSNLDFIFELGLRHQTNTRFISDFLFKRQVIQSPYKVGFINAAAWFTSIDIIKEIGGFSPTFFHYGEDNNYGQRLLKKGYDFYIEPLAKIFHDCPQTNRRTYQGVRKNALREYPEYLILLSNPKYSFKYNFRAASLKFFTEFIKSLLPPNLNLFNQQAIIFFYLIRDFIHIRKNYKTQNKKGPFLSLK